MLRVFVLIVILVHGLIHLMGFLKAFQMAKLEQLTLPISRTLGLIWLLAAILFVIVWILYIWNVTVWWSIAWLAIVVSQVLIVLFWKDAWLGTLANIILLLPSIVAWGTWNFNRSVEHELRILRQSHQQSAQRITARQIGHLPPAVQTWLTRSNSIGKQALSSATVKQSGYMRTSRKGKWMPFRATQWFSSKKPGFLWKTHVDAGLGLHLLGRDLFLHGKGHMRIQFLSLFPVADEKGDKIDQGTLLRYLGEIVWFPSAAISPYIRWKQMSSERVEATMTYEGKSVSGTFSFTKTGDFSSFRAKRYYSRGDRATLEDWLIQVEKDSYTEFEGIRVPEKVRVTWKLKEGDFMWYKVRIQNIVYNTLLSKR